MTRSVHQHEELMLRAAELYYYEGNTQAAVAQVLGCTRWTVGRLLEDAKNVGIVRIVIDHPKARRHELEVRLKQQFGLRDAIVVPAQPNAAVTLKSVAAAASRHLCSIRPTVRRIGVAWGRTVAAIAAEMPEGWSPGVEVVQTNGGPAMARGNPLGESIYTLAERGPGTVRGLAAPTLVDSAELARLMRKDNAIGDTLRAAESARVMLYSPGTVDSDSVLVQSGFVSPEQISQIQQLGVVGDVMSHYIDPHGVPANADLDARTIALGLEFVRKCPNVMAVATGRQKIAATRAAVTAGLCTTLITDSTIAAALLSDNDPAEQLSSMM